MSAIDFFVSRINHQIERYISRKSDFEAVVTDAFSVKQNMNFIIAFLPLVKTALVPKYHQESEKHHTNTTIT